MANRKPTITGTVTGTTFEDSGVPASGAVIVTDPDPGQSATAITSGTSTYGSWAVDANGNWTYFIDNGNATIQAMAAGQIKSDSFKVTSLDGSVTKTIKITITGTNDIPTITGTATGKVVENGTSTATGTLTIKDVDAHQSHSQVVTNAVAAHGTWSVTDKGKWTYNLNNADPAVQALPAGQTMTDSFTVTSLDGTKTQVVSITITGTNDVPTIAGTTVGGVSSHGTLTTSGTLTVTDVDTGESHTKIVSNQASTYGSWSIDADGHWGYQVNSGNATVQALAVGATLTDTFTVTSLDGTKTQLVSVTITGTDGGPTNHAPTTTGQSVAGNEDTPILGQLTASDIDGDTLSYALALNGGPAHGNVIINPNGSYSYTPAADYNGPDSFTYQVSDGHGGTASASVALTVNPVDDAPVAPNASFSTAEDTSLTGAVVATDIDSASLTYALVGSAPAGLVFNADGTFSYTPPADFNGQVSFSYKANDGSLDSNAATATIDVALTNHAPTTTGQSVSGNEDTPILGQLTASDIDGDTLSYALALNGGPAHGNVIINPNGSYSYTPAADYNGPDSFTYQVSDGHGGTASASVALTVNPVDDAPVAPNASFSTAEDTNLTGAVVATDIDSASLTYALVGSAPAGLVFNADGTFSYTPPADFNGQVSFNYKANDGSLDSNAATATINVTPVDDAPVAPNASFSTAENTSLTSAVVATDIDSASLTYALVGSAPAGLVFNADGTFSYNPPADFSGQVSFSYKANDGSLDSNAATATIDVALTNHAPTTTGQSVSGNEDTPILGQLTASDIDGDTLSYALALNGGPAHGNVIINPNGSYSYTPAADYNGPDSFTYQVSDGHGGTASASVALTFNPVDDAPVAPNASFSTAEDTSLTGAVVATDIDSASLTYALVGSAPAGLVFNADGTFSYTPPADFNGQVSFNYKANDGSLDSNAATATINVTPVDDAPVAPNASFSTAENTSLTSAVVATDIDSASLTYALVGSAPAGLVFHADGTFDYTPPADFNGQVSFSYKANDGSLDSNSATATIDVALTNHAPTTTGQSVSGNEDTPILGQLTASDIDGDTLSYALALNGGPAHGNVIINPNGSYSYTPAADYYGSDSFIYQVSDGHGGTATANVALTVNPVYDSPQNPVIINAFDTTAYGSPDPSGLAFIPGTSPGTGTLLLSDSEADETPFFFTNNLFTFSLGGTFDHKSSLESFTIEPTGLAYDVNNGHLFISDDDRNGVFEVDANNPGVKLNFFSTSAYATDAEDVAYDPVSNHLFVIEGDTGAFNAASIFETTTSGSLIRRMSLPAPITDPEAITYDSVNQVFYVSGGFSPDIWVVSRDGHTILDTITVLEGITNTLTGTSVHPKGLLLAPSSNPNDDPNTMSIYVADYGKDQVMDGRIYEIQLKSNPTQSALFTANNDVVDFNHIVAGSYLAGSQYNTLAGDDTVTLPIDAAAAAAAGYIPVQTEFHAGIGNDIIEGGGLTDTIYGDAGNDIIHGGGGNDRLFGTGGTDTISGGLGDDYMDGGSATDTVDYSAAATAVTVNLLAGTATGEGHDTLLNFENVTGSGLDDTITGNAGNNVLLGGLGNDTIHGGDGNDTLTGGSGLDHLFGDAGTDTLKWDSADKLDGGTGFDTVDANLSSADTIDLRGPDIVNVERILTGGGNDTVTLSLSDVLSDTADHQFVASLGSGTDTLNIDFVGGWAATTSNPTLGPTGVAAGISVAGMTAYTFTNGTDTATVFSDAEVLHAQILS